MYAFAKGVNAVRLCTLFALMQCDVLKFRRRQGGMSILIIDTDQENKNTT